VDDIIGDGLISETVVGQIGEGSCRPGNFEAVPTMEKADFDRHIEQASAIIGHAGMGTITMALNNNKPLLAMPRLSKYGEVVNDHQVGIAERFAELGYILAAGGVEDLPDGIRRLRDFVPKKRITDPNAVVDRIQRFLSSFQS
ncbi:MAG: glycosyltransferase, partial [Planctomycetota bacterium]|jgi:UDP-N-acetylglucosamine transferase subunit ALG13